MTMAKFRNAEITTIAGRQMRGKFDFLIRLPLSMNTLFSRDTTSEKKFQVMTPAHR